MADAQRHAQAQMNAATEALTLCGVLDNTNNTIFNDPNAAERIAGEVFSDNFNTCIDITFMELEDNWKTQFIDSC